MKEYGGMVLIRYKPDLLKYGSNMDEYKKICKWMDTLSYNVEWAHLSGKRVGFFVSPEDATLFTLIFGSVE